MTSDSTSGKDPKRAEVLIQEIGKSITPRLRVELRELELGRLEVPEESLEKEFLPIRKPIRVQITQTPIIRLEYDSVEATASDLELNLFSTGIAVVRLKLSLFSEQKISPEKVLGMEAIFVKQIEDTESKMGVIIWELIQAVLDGVSRANSDNRLATYPPRTRNQKIGYIYPIYYFPENLVRDEIRRYLCGLYLRKLEELSDDELNRKLMLNNSNLRDAWLIIDWEASIASGTLYSGTIDSLVRTFEIMSYVCYSACSIDSALGNELRELLKSDPTISIREAEQQLVKVRVLREVVNDIFEEYRNIRVSLWRSVIDLFDKISTVWTLERLEEAVSLKVKLLDYVFRDLTQLLDRRLNETLNKRLLAFQYMGLRWPSSSESFST